MQKILDNKDDRLNKYILKNGNFSHKTINIKGPGLSYKGWELKVFKIYTDTFVQQNLISTSKELWNIIEERRHGKEQ